MEISIYGRRMIDPLALLCPPRVTKCHRKPLWVDHERAQWIALSISHQEESPFVDIVLLSKERSACKGKRGSTIT